MWTLITIVVCLWAIALEIRLRQRDKAVDALAGLLVSVATGCKTVALTREGKLEIQPNRGVK